MPRRFGPTLAAGVAVIEKDAGQTIVPSPLGVTCYVGVCEKGTPGEVISVPKQRDFVRKCGTYIDESELADAAFDFYTYSGGAGQLFVVRVTDGTEVSAADYVTGRTPGVGEYVNRDTGVDQKAPMLSVTAKNGGRWAGAERVLSFDYTIATDLTETTLDTSEAMLVDEFKGATLKLLGVTTATYSVVSNTAAGVLTVESDSRMASDLAAGAATNNAAVLYLDAETREFNGPGSVSGDRRALSLSWKDGEEDQDLYFGLDVLVDGSVVRSYNNLSLDPANKWYVDSVINQDPGNEWITITVVHAGTYNAANRPASWFCEYKSYAAGVLSTKVCHVSSVVPNTPGNDIGFVTAFEPRARTVRQRITVTLTAATTFSVTTTAARGAEHKDLPVGAVGTPYATTLNANDRTDLDFIPSFTLFRGVDDFEAGDVFVIDVDPFPVEFAASTGTLSGYVEVDSGTSRERVKIDSNTVDTITFSNLPAAAPTVASGIAADLQSTGDITFPTAGGNIELLCDLVGFVTLTYAVEANATALVSTLNAAALAEGLPNTLFSATGDKLNILLSTVYDAATGQSGADQFFELVTVPAEIDIAATAVQGVDGDRFRVEAPRELRDGYDGDTPADSDYIAAFNTVTSPINRLLKRNLGLVKLAAPGVTSTNIQKAGLAYAEFRNYQFRVEIPTNLTDEASVVNYLNSTIGRNDYGVTFWPSYGYRVSPTGEGIVLRTMTGAIHGREARVAADFGGYHKAAAGDRAPYTLPHIIDTPLGDVEIDEEITNPQGVNVIVKKNGVYCLWGDRTLSVNPAWKFKHAREYMSHVENVFRVNFDFVVFALNDAETRKTLVPVFKAFFKPEFQKRAISGDTLEDAVSIKIDEENNTDLDVDNGDMNADISFRIVGVVERLNISVSKKGIFTA